MKIAICISGFIRTWEYTKYNFIEALCKKLPTLPDIFVHTYNQNFYDSDVEVPSNEYLEQKEIECLLNGINLISLVVEDRDEALKELQEKGKKFINHKQYNRLFPESGDSLSKDIPYGLRIMDQLRKIELCNDMKIAHEKKHNFIYDVVIRTRFDMVYKDLKWENLIKGIESDQCITSFGCTSGGPVDTVGAGSSKVMDIYSTRYSNIEEYQDFCGHGSLNCVLTRNNILIYKEPFVETRIIRMRKSEVKAYEPFIFSTNNQGYTSMGSLVSLSYIEEKGFLLK